MNYRSTDTIMQNSAFAVPLNLYSLRIFLQLAIAECHSTQQGHTSLSLPAATCLQGYTQKLLQERKEAGTRGRRRVAVISLQGDFIHKQVSQLS